MININIVKNTICHKFQSHYIDDGKDCLLLENYSNNIMYFSYKNRSCSENYEPTTGMAVGTAVAYKNSLKNNLDNYNFQYSFFRDCEYDMVRGERDTKGCERMIWFRELIKEEKNDS